MVWAVCEDLGVDYSQAVVLYQSRFYAEMFPEENQRFANVEYVEAVVNDRDASLLHMRKAMLSRGDLVAAVFIGGMEGVLAEYSLFRELQPSATIVTVPSAGGAALELAERQDGLNDKDRLNIDFARLFHTRLSVAPNEPRLTTI